MASCNLFHFILFLSFVTVYGYVLESEDPTETILWPSEYHFKGEKFDLLLGTKETFEMWYKSEVNKSRIDFYDGIVKKYYVAETDEDGEDSGMAYEFSHITTLEGDVEEKCEEVSYSGPAEDFLVSTDDFTYQGTEIFQDNVVSIWVAVTEEPGVIRNEETLYVYRRKEHDEDVDIPLQYIVKSFNLNRGNMNTHTITSYYNFKANVDDDDVTPETESCNSYTSTNTGSTLERHLRVLHPDVKTDMDIVFKSFTKHHNKKYRESERAVRKFILKHNWRYVRHHNNKNLSFKMAVNKYADRTDEELSYLTGTLPSKPGRVGTPFPHTKEETDLIAESIPETYDMRFEGYISPVKNQDECGSCWAFCTTAAVEGAISRSLNGKDMDLSEQSLVDCSWAYGNLGCNGGMLDDALKYVLEYGIPTESDYGPYLHMDGVCDIKNMTSVQRIRAFYMVTPNSPTAMKVALFKYGPVTVAINAKKSMLLYDSGVYYDTECNHGHINHGVTVVGYGIRDGDLYWVVKNSWGEDWGEDGYIMMAAQDDNCFVLNTPFVPIV